MITCQCGMAIVKPSGGTIACRRCGIIVDVPVDIAKPSDTCIYRGESIGIAKCGCGGNPKVYTCGIHEFAMDRKLTPGKVRVQIDGIKSTIDTAYCRSCGDYRTTG